jgi:hypothetical protein
MWEVAGGALIIHVDMGRLTSDLTRAQLGHHHTAIVRGLSPEGSSQPNLGPKEAKRAQAGKRSQYRGMGQEGRFPASLKVKSTKGVTAATGLIGAAPFFDNWQHQEASRGVFYFAVSGQADNLTSEVILSHLQWMGLQ